MKITETGNSLEIGGKTFVVGGRVFSNQMSDYRHLFGKVREFQSGDESDNDPNQMYVVCDFDLPDSIDRVIDLEDRFSKLHGSPQKIGQISLDCVVMAADMLEPIAPKLPEQPAAAGNRMYALTYRSESENGVSFGCLGVSAGRSELLKQMLDFLEKQDVKMTAVEEAEDMYRFSFEGINKFLFLEIELDWVPAYTAAYEEAPG